MVRPGIWLDAQRSAASDCGAVKKYKWSFDIPVEGWTEAIVNTGFAENEFKKEITFEIYVDGILFKETELKPYSVEHDELFYKVDVLGEIAAGSHNIEVCLPSEHSSGFLGLWVTNGPLLYGWPKHTHAVDYNKVLTYEPAPVPVMLTERYPIEFGMQGLASHFNQQGAIGAADGKITAVPRSLRLRYTDCELNIMVRNGDGFSRVKDVCPEISLSLLDDWQMCPVTRFSIDGVDYEIIFAAVPEHGEVVDMVKIKACNNTREIKKNRIAALLDAAEDFMTEKSEIVSSGDIIAYLGGSAGVVKKTREYGLADLKSTTAAAAWITPFVDRLKSKWDSSFFSYRIGWDGKPVRYCLKCAPGSRYAIYLGVYDPGWDNPGSLNPGQKQIYAGEKVTILDTDGPAEAVSVDCRKPESPAAVRMEACDDDGDGIINIYAYPDKNIPGSIGILNAIWVFPESAHVGMDDLLTGKLNGDALHYIDVGGSTPGYVLDRVMSEDWTYAYAEITGLKELMPGQADEYTITLPVNHRPEIMCYSQPRHWREPGEDAPSFISRLEKRHAAAKAAVLNPEKALEKVRGYWTDIIGGCKPIRIPEKNIENILTSSLCYFTLQRLKINDKCHLPMCGPFFYFDFAERDGSYVLLALDYLGRSGETESTLNSFLTARGEIENPRWFLGQDGEGRWLSREHEEDTQGQVLWSLGEYFMLTGDREWLKKAWPWIKRGLGYIRKKRGEQKAKYPDPEDPRHGIWIAGTDEGKSFGQITHSYYFSYWIECALRFGITEAEAMGEHGYAGELRSEYEDYVGCLKRSLDKTFFEIDHARGTLPDTVEKPGAYNIWGVQESLWPSHTLGPWDLKAERSLSYLNAMSYSRSGCFPCSVDSVWPSATGDYGLMHLRRGEGDKAVECFYSMVSACGLVNSWGEVIHLDTGTATGEQPYTWANAAFVILLRNMLVHEAGEWIAGNPAGPGELWICPAVPRKWLDEPEGIAVENLPSYFGPVSFTCGYDTAAGSYKAVIDLSERVMPKRLTVFFRTLKGNGLKRVSVNGGNYECFTGEHVIIPAPPRHVEISAWN